MKDQPAFYIDQRVKFRDTLVVGRIYIIGHDINGDVRYVVSYWAGGAPAMAVASEYDLENAND